MVANLRRFVDEEPKERSIFAFNFAKYIKSTTDYRKVPARYFFCLPIVTENVMWDPFPPVHLENVKTYTIIDDDNQEEVAEPKFIESVFVFRDFLFTQL